MAFYLTDQSDGNILEPKVLDTIADVNSALDDNQGKHIHIAEYCTTLTEPDALATGDWILHQLSPFGSAHAKQIKAIWEAEAKQLVIQFLDYTCYTIGHTLRADKIIRKLDM